MWNYCNGKSGMNPRARSCSGRNAVFASAFGFLVCFIASPVHAQDTNGCGPLQNAFGPFDYRTVGPENRRVVEAHHFTPAVEALLSGTTGQIGADIDYTLRAMPNHHRALLAMTKLSFKEHAEKPRGSNYTVDCWYRRAITFKEDDGMVRVLYADYLLKRGKKTEALKQLERAEALSEGSANISYNLGLGYFEVKDYQKSLKYAHRAYALGFPLPGLRNKLEKAGKWTPPPQKAAAEGDEARKDKVTNASETTRDGDEDRGRERTEHAN